MEKKRIRTITAIVLVAVMCAVIGYYQTRKVGLHEDEAYTLTSSVSAVNGLMSPYEDGHDGPVWRSREYVNDYVTLTPENYLNFAALYHNQAIDAHPPLFYTAVHFCAILFGGKFNLYTVFAVNLILFILSCLVLGRILHLLDKGHLLLPVLLLYGLCMGTVSMVLYQRMYMMLTLFILLYYYVNLKLYRRGFVLDRKLLCALCAVTVAGFLVQYFFAIYAVFIFLIMLVGMVRHRTDLKTVGTYIAAHIGCAVAGIVLFVPCIVHLFFSARGVSNLSGGGFAEHAVGYLHHIAYLFTAGQGCLPVVIAVLLLFLAGAALFCFKCREERFVLLITLLPSVLYFPVAVKMTSFQEVRYIMAMIPFLVLVFFFVLDGFVRGRYKNIILTAIAVVIVGHGVLFSQPMFLYEDYRYSLDIAHEHSDKSFVYVYDNAFNHMQSLPEMMIYKRTLILNDSVGELRHAIDDPTLNAEESFVLSIKSYMDAQPILDALIEQSEFNHVTLLYEGYNIDSMINSNYYLISK